MAEFTTTQRGARSLLYGAYSYMINRRGRDQEEIQRIATAPNSLEVAARLPTLAAMKSSLYTRRRMLIPQLPTTRADVHFEGEWALSVKGENFLLVKG